MAETSETPRGADSGIPPEVRQYKRTISDLLPDKYEFSADPHLYIASSLPPDNQLCSTEEEGTNKGDDDHKDVDILLGPAEHNNSLPVVQNTATGEEDAYNIILDTNIQAHLPVGILSPADEDESTNLPGPEKEHEPHSLEEEAQQQNAGTVRESDNDEVPLQAMTPRMAPNNTDPALLVGEETASEVEEDAAHRMLQQAVADLQAENASLSEALSVQSHQLQSFREAAQHSAAEQTATAQSQDEGAEEEQSASLVQELGAHMDFERAQAVPKDRTEALYRSLELKVQQLKLERDAMERALRREVGDDTPLTKLLDADSDWRGRAQTIALLKEKLLSLHETRAQAMGNPSSARNRHDANNRANLERLRGERAREADELRAELASMRAALEDALHRQQGASARKKALEKEVRSLKQKVVLLLDKSATDDSLIAALRSPAARLGAFASSAAVPHQSLSTARGSFSTAASALTGPAVTWEAPERGGSRVSVVVPGGPAPEQAPAGEPLLTSAAESAPIQRTSFSISLDINTNTVSIQGSVTSPNQSDRTAKSAPALSISPDSASCVPIQQIKEKEEGPVEGGATQEGQEIGVEQTAEIEEGWEPLVEDDCTPEEVLESREDANSAEAVGESGHVSDEAYDTLGVQKPATECVADNEMASTYTAEAADVAAPSVDTNIAVQSTQTPGYKSIISTEGTFTLSASGKNRVASSNALESVEAAHEGDEAWQKGHGSRSEEDDAIDKALEDAIAEVQQAVAQYDS